MKQIHIVEKSKLFFIISLCLIIAGIVLLIVPGLNLGLDFTEGATITVKLNVSSNESNMHDYADNIEKFIEDKGFSVGNTRVAAGESSLQFDLGYVYNGEKLSSGEFSDILGDEENGLIKDIVDYINKEGNTFIKETVNGEEYITSGDQNPAWSFTSPAAARSLAGKAILAILVAIVAMLIYIAIRFKLSSGISAVIVLVHDVMVMLLLTAFSGIFGLKVNFTFIAAVITVIGYSINATIIVFDRIKENLAKYESQGLSDGEIANISVRETIRRTVFTTLTTLVMIVLIAVIGVDSIREFVLPIIFGLLSGTYSAIVLSSCVWVQIRKIGKKFVGNKKKGYAKYAKEKSSASVEG